jgi:hypothetical protein
MNLDPDLDVHLVPGNGLEHLELGSLNVQAVEEDVVVEPSVL